MSVNLFRRFFEGIKLSSKGATSATGLGDLEVVNAKLQFHNGTTVKPVLTEHVVDISMAGPFADDSTVPSSKAVKSALDVKVDPTDVIDYWDFNTAITPAPVNGRVHFDQVDKTLSIDIDTVNGVQLQVGQEEYVRVVNKTGAQINDGQVVYINGAQGNRPTAALALASTITSSSVIGVATQNIADNAEGMITTSGVVGGYDTSGFLDGDQLFLSAVTPGLLTKVVPTSPNKVVQVATALNSTVSGKILVSVKCALDADITLSSNSDHISPSEKAVKAYVDNTAIVKQNKFNGLEDSSLFTVSYVPATRIFTVTCAGGAAAYINGVRYLCTTQSTTAHANTTGKWYLYYDATGTLVVASSPWVLSQSAPVSLVYYNATNVTSIMFNEKHGGPTGMDDATHAYLHSTRGTQVLSGFAISGYTLNTAGLSNLSYAIDSGSLADEDLITNVAAVPDGGPYRVMSRTGVSGEWTWDDTSLSGILDNGTNLYYNQFTGGTWQLTPITTNSTWVNYYILAVPTSDGSTGSVIMMGQATYGSLAAAQAEEPSTAIAGFSNFTTEGVFIARMTYRRVSGASPSNAELASVQPIRTNSISVTSGFTPTDHQSLSNRSAIGTHPASSITNAPSGNLIATDVQSALDELQTELDGKATLTSVETFSNKSLIDSTTSIIDVVDPTKIIKFDAAGTTGTSTTLLGSQTVNRILTLPDETDTLATQTNAKAQAIKYSLIF